MTVKHAVSVLIIVSVAVAQVPQGSIVGRVVDPTGAQIAGAQVTVQNQGTGNDRSTITSGSGEFALPNLDPGQYRITISAQGFKTSVASNVTLNINQTVRVDRTLELGDVATRVEVAATSPVVQTDASSVGSVVEGKQITTMPLNGRQNLFGLIALSPGVQNPQMNPAIAGNFGYGAVDLRIDGVSGNDMGNERNLPTVPSIEAVSEFKVIANSASAEFGNGGAQIIVATRSGSNEFHGGVFFFNRNRATAANNFFSNRAGLGLPKFNRNEYGAFLGGPVQRNKLFLFGSFEGFRQASAQNIVTQMPSRAMRQGDFRLLPALRDPFNNGAPYPNNQIPANQISPVARGLDPFFSDPNLPGVGPAGLGNNFTANVGSLQNVDRYSVRGDWSPNTANRFTGRFFRSVDGPYNATGAAFGTNVGTDKFGNWEGFGNGTNNTLISYTRIFTPALINEARLGMQHNRFFRTPQNSRFDPTTLIPGLIKPLPGLGGLPTVSILGFRGFNDQPGSGDRQANYEISDTITWYRNRHTIKIGFLFQRVSSFNFQNTPPRRGQFTFDGRYTGNSMADFLIGGLIFTSRNTRNAETEPKNNRYHAFVQDDWNIHPKLTLNLGMRYEYATPFSNTEGELANFDAQLRQLVVVSGIEKGDPRLLNSLPIVEGRTVGQDFSNYIFPDRNNWAPRVGLAYRPFGGARLVTRASYGIFYNPIAAYNGTLQQAITNPPFRVQETFEAPAGAVPTITWANPFPGAGGLPASPGLDSVARNRRNPYMQQWNFTVESEVRANLGVRVSYVGAKGTRLERNANINEPPQAPGAVQPRRPFQPWGPITFWESGRNSILHQMQLGVIRRFSSGFTAQLEYSFSRSLTEIDFFPFSPTSVPPDNQNFRYARGNQDGIRRHYAVANYIYDLPIGRGKRFLGNAAPIVDKILGGWQFAGILSMGTGQPYTVIFTPNVAGWLASHASYAPGKTAADVKPPDQSIDKWFDPAAFTAPQPFTFGNSARNAFFGPGLFALDQAFFKNTRINERVNTSFRAELFNLTNTANFATPQNNISVPAAAGRITATATAARTIQFGLRVEF